MFGLGPTELLLILGIVFVIFGAGKLSEVGGALGRSIREFRTASDIPPGTTSKETTVTETTTV